jgi:hypothetical protein
VSFLQRRTPPRSRKPHEKADDTAIRVTNQFRRLGAKGAMVYELRSNGMGVELEVAQDPAANAWRIQATSMRAPPQVVMGGWAPTRLEALVAVGKLWQQQELSLDLPRFDWIAMASRLAEVRAV